MTSTASLAALAPLQSLRAILAEAIGTVGVRPNAIYTDDMDTALAMPQSETGTDDGDIAASQRGDGDAFGRLVERHQNDIARLMSRFTPDRRQLEELVQDVFVDAWKSLPGFTRGRPLGPWLRTVAVHIGYRYWKSLKRANANVALDEIAEIAAEGDAVAPERAEQALHDLLGALRPRDRLVLSLLYLEGHTVAQTAELTGWSKTMVKVQAHRARAKLKKLLGKVVAEGDRP